ncbi:MULTISPECIES: carbohydrate ABC transporter permease [Paenibacillus]|uniref:Carbohydrate ABC transporter permease n=1 Tax=Paenibacillus lignilyticus TaxID=1172615 RepID=A0ABS5C7T3_9BACL|nr:MULTISPECIES: carbohydrate ABC transporter permease [Paenibacillus]MBP3961722.1 carbohydrate ABC transporter permease [Paenibacillus lignilyticus]MBP3963607.1 carbohydrate ABC transporter permease [Paenibacillus lignilyticus]SFS55689.1 putative aldouronate transport system permease protein [Paenibacillus sp. BC26]
MKANRIKRTTGERTFDVFNILLMLIWAITAIYPFWYILVMSFNTGADAAAGPIWFFPRVFTLENYAFVFQYDRLHSAFIVTTLRCIIGPVLSVVVTMLAAFALSKRFLPGRKSILFFFMIPMFIGGTIISNYVVISKLDLVNNFLVYVLPGAFGFFSMIIMRTHIEDLPAELQESAFIDGAGYVRIFVQIIFPLCMPVIAAFAFFAVVGNWLDYYTNLIYVTDRSLSTLQFVLYEIINRAEANTMIDFTKTSGAAARRLLAQKNNTVPTPEVIKMTVMVVVTFPLLFVYPFFQKYFVKGMLTGAVKA